MILYIYMDRYILDTNLFFNMEAGIGMGEKTEDVVVNLTKLIKKHKNNEPKTAEFYMPPRIVEEFLSFFENKEQVFIKDLLSQIIVRSPDLGKISVAANVFSLVIEDIRNRSYRGLRVGEEEIVNAGRLLSGRGELAKKDFEITVGQVVKKYRDRYRQATRYGFIDSLGDLDLIFLSKELDGFLVSTDDGVLKWGRVFGVKEMPVKVFGQKLSQ